MAQKPIIIFQDDVETAKEIFECQQAMAPKLLTEEQYCTDVTQFLMKYAEERGNETICVIPSNIHKGIRRVNIADFVQQLKDINPKSHIVLYSNYSNPNLKGVNTSIEKFDSNPVYLDSMLETFAQKYPSLDKVARRESIRHVELINYLFVHNVLQAV